MVIQETSEAPMEAPVVHRSDMESGNNQDVEENSQKRKKSRKRDKSKELKESSYVPSVNSTEINQSDIEELRSVYRKCKEVIKKIESKYGHLINSDDNNVDSEHNKCICKFNKKIVFDDNGQQTTQEIIPDLHICPKRQKYSQPTTSNKNLHSTPNIQIEDESLLNSLPDDMKELCDILKDPKINVVYRNKVIEKIKLMRTDNINTMRFDRKLIIEKLKVQPEQFFEFKGSNITSLPGYPTKPL